MGITPQGARALGIYLDQAGRDGPTKRKLYAAVVLTDAQVEAVEHALKQYWRRPDFNCPRKLPLKPLHGYESRVLRDRFAVAQYREWLEIGCSDAAVVACDRSGRPFLLIAGMTDFPGYAYDLIVPIRSDSKASVSIDDVIPKGLPPGARK